MMGHAITAIYPEKLRTAVTSGRRRAGPAVEVVVRRGRLRRAEVQETERGSTLLFFSSLGGGGGGSFGEVFGGQRRRRRSVDRLSSYSLLLETEDNEGI